MLSDSLLPKEEAWLLQDKYRGERSLAYESDLVLLKKGVPLAYLIGWVEFLGNRIDLSSHPLIPRTETEWWCEAAYQELRQSPTPPQNCLDIFAGSGCIGISFLTSFPFSRVDFAEIEIEHIHGIRQSCEQNSIPKERYTLLQSDIFSRVTEIYDVIFANPPYIDRTLQNVEKDVLEHEPHLALFSEDNGRRHITELLKEAGAHLRPEGVLYLEYSPLQKEWVEDIAVKHGFIPNMRKDQYDTYRWAQLKKDKSG